MFPIHPPKTVGGFEYLSFVFYMDGFKPVYTHKLPNAVFRSLGFKPESLPFSLRSGNATQMFCHGPTQLSLAPSDQSPNNF